MFSKGAPLMPYYTLSQEDLQKSLSFDPSELIEKNTKDGLRHK